MPEAIALTSPLERLNLKDKSQEELLSGVLDKPKWSEEEKALVQSAYDMALQLHRDDKYKDQPYILHLLRVANRITGYLRLFDAELVAAALLHDSVEDHSHDISQQSHNDEKLHQQVALTAISSRFSPRVANLVATVTNEADRDEHLSEEQKIAAYTQKVKQAIQTPDGWVIKFADWCDNGLGISYGAELLDSEQMSYFLHKYGGNVLEALEQRFHQPDLQGKLDTFAKGYVESQLELGHQRLPDNEAIAEELHKHRHFTLQNILHPEDD